MCSCPAGPTKIVTVNKRAFWVVLGSFFGKISSFESSSEKDCAHFATMRPKKGCENGVRESLSQQEKAAKTSKTVSKRRERDRNNKAMHRALRGSLPRLALSKGDLKIAFEKKMEMVRQRMRRYRERLKLAVKDNRVKRT